jgi:4-hydroxybenzoate polyprenyltransferase
MASPRKPPPRARPAAPLPDTLRDRRSPQAATGFFDRLREKIPPHVRDRLREYALLTRQDKPVGWLLLLWPTWWALWIAAGGVPPIGTLVIFTLGVIVMRSAGCAINDIADRKLDAQVARTRDRPLAAGRVTTREAFGVFGALLVVALLLVLATNQKTILVSLGAVALAVLYPFMKRRTWWPQVWLGAAFGMSIPMAFTAVTNDWPPPIAWLLFVANVLWSTAYDTFYAMVDRDDDLRAGAKSTAILFGELDLVAIGLLFGAFLLAMWLVGTRAELGDWYRIGWLAAAAHAAWQIWFARDRSRTRCFVAFKSNAWLGGILFGGMAVDAVVRAAG